MVYVAAGMINVDGTHVYALDAATGRIRWQNNTSGHLDTGSGHGSWPEGLAILDALRDEVRRGRGRSPHPAPPRGNRRAA